MRRKQQIVVGGALIVAFLLGVLSSRWNTLLFSPTSTPTVVQDTPIPSPTMPVIEKIVSSDNPEMFESDDGEYHQWAVDVFEPQGDVILKLAISKMSFPNADASNGIVIDNDLPGRQHRSIALVYQENEWRLFEHMPQMSDMDLIWTDQHISPNTEWILHLASDGRHLLLRAAGKERHLVLSDSLWAQGDRLVVRIQVASDSRFQIDSFLRLTAESSSPVISTLEP